MIASMNPMAMSAANRSIVARPLSIRINMLSPPDCCDLSGAKAPGRTSKLNARSATLKRLI
jgi:hypothetical protein